MSKKVNFTKTVIDRLVYSHTSPTYYYDNKVPHHRLVISPKGLKTFQVYMRFENQPIKRKIGCYPDISPEKARELAKKLISEIVVGVDKHQQKVAKKKEPTYADIWIDYLAHLKDKTNQKPDTADKNLRAQLSVYKQYKEFHELQLSQITLEKLIKFHRDYSIKKGKKIAANNIIRQIRACFNYANFEPNPAISRRLKLNKQVARNKYLKPNEVQAFVTSALQDQSRDYRDVFLLCLFTAARIGSVMGMEWKDINLEFGVWEPITKSSEDGEDRTPIGLTNHALNILFRRETLNIEKSKWVFPATSKSGHVSQPQKAFNRILESAGLKGYTPHDLRRTAVSHFAQSSASDQELLTLLGNKSLDTLATYAKNDVSLVKERYNVVLDRMLKDIDFI